MENKKIVTIKTEYITLGQLLKFLRIVGQGGEEKAYLASHTVTVNGENDNRRGRKLRPGDVVSMREKDRDMIAVVYSLKRQSAAPVNWLSWDASTMQGTLLSVPTRAEIPENIEMQLIVEFFSR